MSDEREKCEFGTEDNCDRPEQANTAAQEIEVARRELAKAVNSGIDHTVGDHRLEQLSDLARIIEMIR